MVHAVVDAAPSSEAPVVLKFGSSVLRSKDDLPSVVTELYRHVRAGRKVVAIVSAFAGETDRLYDEALLFGPGFLSRHAVGLISVGEARAVSLLAVACDRTGLDAAPLDARQLGLRARGPFDNAEPVGHAPEAVLEALKSHDIVVAPGYVAIDDDGAPVLLGRGGSDLSAMMVASALGSDSATLFKNIPGVFEGLGVRAEGDDADPRVYDQISPATAARHGNALVQEKALQYAVDNNLTVQITALGAPSGVRISNEDGPLQPVADKRPVRVGVAGLGIVGEGAALRLLADPGHYEIASLLVHNPNKPRNSAFDASLLTTDPAAFLAAKPDIVIDLMSSGAAGAELMRAALEQGVSVISANKQAVAEDLPGARALAKDKGAHLAYGAAVGGGAPMVESAASAGARGAVASIDAVLNGTVNFILSELQKGAAFEVALKAAQDAGFAEADPSADLSGDDARAKAAILAYEAYGVGLNKIDFEIEGLDAEKGASLVAAGGAWRQVTRIRPQTDGRVKVKVAYEQVDDDPFLSRLRGEANAIRIQMENGQVIAARGRGAGRVPTVESVLGDLGAYRRGRGRSA
ncbi:MAG: homoserine dehydrogenase [Pseudomonadota bacterium]